jgi:hypothetical protein
MSIAAPLPPVLPKPAPVHDLKQASAYMRAPLARSESSMSFNRKDFRLAHEMLLQMMVNKIRHVTFWPH